VVLGFGTVGDKGYLDTDGYLYLVDRRVHAIITPTDRDDSPTFDEVKAYAKGRLLPYKVPKSIEIVDAIPRSEAMKVNRGPLVEARGG
jgi:bile acid-coenzyme A ligase